MPKLGSWQRYVCENTSDKPWNPLRELKGKGGKYSSSYYNSLKNLVNIGALEWAKGPQGGANYVIAGPKLQETLTNS